MKRRMEETKIPAFLFGRQSTLEQLGQFKGTSETLEMELRTELFGSGRIFPK